MIAIERGNYIVMIDPLSIIDAIPNSDRFLDIAVIGLQNKMIISATSTIDPKIIRELTLHSTPIVYLNDSIYFLKTYPQLNIKLIAWSSFHPLKKRMLNQLTIWGAIGGIATLISSYFMVSLFRRQSSLFNQLRYAISDNDIRVHYQPIISLITGDVVGAEALCRWKQVDGNYVSPDIFIPLAEDNELTDKLTLLVINDIFNHLEELLKENPDIYISVNLSFADLMSPSVFLATHKNMELKGVKPSQIVFELTERKFIVPSMGARVISKLRSEGFKIYLDDFGTGYSNLNYLQNLNVDAIKIDKLFVQALESNEELVRHIVSLAKSLGIEIVAEGIENKQQESWLKNHGVTYG
ncbi:TPA: EAL domain-containing protein [Salmonella enterica subsp. enterica]|nr:EAL domain-containing protein [Salmonella enterica subsp. enterica]HCZ2452049.1 EAL domain-containing protein [Salmonella enterica subsp. enterica]